MATEEGKACHFAGERAFEDKENFCSTKLEVEKCALHWTIDNFSLQRKNFVHKLIESIRFSSTNGKCEWCVLLYPWHDGNMIEIYLALKKGPETDVLAKCMFSFRDWKNREISKFLVDECYRNLVSSLFWHCKLKRDELLKELQNDILNIRIEITAITGEITSELSISRSESNLGIHLFSLYESSNFCDFVIAVEGKDIPVHRAVLAARSPVFRAMLQNETLEDTTRRMEITDFENRVISCMLKFFYTDAVPILDVPLAMELLAAANKYAVGDLKEICANYLMVQLSLSNVLDVLLLADTHSVTDLKRKCMVCLLSNKSIVSALKESRSDLEKHPSLLFDLLITSMVESRSLP